MGFFDGLFGRKPAQPQTVARLPGPGAFDLEIVGEFHYQDTLEQLCGGRCEGGHEKQVEATLIHEDQNPHDNKAIAVLIEGKLVGYLDRKTARNFRRQLAVAGAAGAPAVCQAKIVGGWDRGRNDRGHFGVRLDLPTK